jgi:hypothetical protein
MLYRNRVQRPWDYKLAISYISSKTEVYNQSHTANNSGEKQFQKKITSPLILARTSNHRAPA